MSPQQVLIVEDNEQFRDVLEGALERSGIQVTSAGSLSKAHEFLRHSAYDVIALDQKLPDGSGMDLLRELSREVPAPQVIMMAGIGDVPAAVEATRLGAIDYLVKPFDLEEFVLKVGRAFQIIANSRKATLSETVVRARSTYYPAGASSSNRIREVFRLIDDYAGAAPTPVLITGETGVGKERAARSLHSRSGRAQMPFVALNCATFDTPLLESELFGHERGAFTSAAERKIGMIELASGGTLFLDEIGDMPVSAQAKLLRALETKTFRRVGGTQEIRGDFWVISATNRPFSPLIEEKQFRADLYYRLSTLTLNIPPLRERVEDIPDLVAQICRELLGRHSSEVTFDEGVLEAFESYPWPGNIRELRNIVERSLIVNKDHTIRLPPGFQGAETGQTEKRRDLSTGPDECALLPGGELCSTHVTLKQFVECAEKQAVQKSLRQHAGNRIKSAAMLGISLATLKRLIKQHNLTDSN